MEPTTDISIVWQRSRKPLEELAAEQGYRPPSPEDPPIVGFMDDEEWEAFTQTVRRWRDESSRE